MRRFALAGDQTDLLASLLFLAVGGLGLWLGRDLSTGELASMGPGYVPRVLSLSLLALGIATGLKGLRGARVSLVPVQARVVVAVLVAVVGFAIIVPSVGLVVGCLWLVGVSRMAVRGVPTRETLILMGLLTAGSVVVFAVCLGVQVRIWPV